MTPEACPRYESCNAPLCPLDARWQFRSYGRGEAVCDFVLEAVKPNGAATVRRRLPDEMAATVLQAAPEMALKFPFIAHRLARASSQGSRTLAVQAARRGRRVSAANVA